MIIQKNIYLERSFFKEFSVFFLAVKNNKVWIMTDENSMNTVVSFGSYSNTSEFFY